MTNFKTAPKIGILSGVASAVLFWLGAMAALFLSPPDPQLAIAFVFAPLFAIWCGASVGLLVSGGHALYRGSRKDSPLLLVALGIAGLLLATGFVVGEVHQAYYGSVVYPAIR